MTSVRHPLPNVNGGLGLLGGPRMGLPNSMVNLNASSNPTGQAQQTSKKYETGIVKQVLDIGAVVIRGMAALPNGPPPERTIFLGELDIPKMGRRQAGQVGTASYTQDEPLAWQAREFLRKTLLSKQVVFNVSYANTVSGREYGNVYVGNLNPDEAEDVVAKLVSSGLARVRETCQNSSLKDLQEVARTQGVGVWASDAASKVRNVTWEHENPRQLVDRYGGKEIDAIVEHVRDGSTVRLTLLPNFHHITLMISGIRCPTVKTGSEGRPDAATAEPFGLEAHYFTESRLLQKEVKVVLESVNNKNFIGSIIHPAGNIAIFLLKEGLAKIVDWSLQLVTTGRENYRSTQSTAKEARIGIWKDFKSIGPLIAEKDKTFTAKVIEIINGDGVMVRKNKNDVPRKIFLASIKPPKLTSTATSSGTTPNKTFKALYDIPYMFEAREFLRKKLIHQNVHVIVDYVQPANQDFAEKTCGTITIGGINVGEALVARGLATVVRYAADNDQRSSCYDDLLAAEDKAIKSNKGMHEKKKNAATEKSSNRRIVDLTGDVAKSKQFLPFLLRAGKLQGVVEFVASGSRLRVYVPRETCVITLLLGGISCPRASRVDMATGKVVTPGQEFGDQALAAVKEMVLQSEVEIEVEGMDKGGNYIGYLTTNRQGGNSSMTPVNLSVFLVEEGYATSYIMGGVGGASSGGGPSGGSEVGAQYANAILAAEDRAKTKKIRQWVNYDLTQQNVVSDDYGTEGARSSEDTTTLPSETAPTERNLVDVFITDVREKDAAVTALGLVDNNQSKSSAAIKIFAQNIEDGMALESLMNEMRAELKVNPPMTGAYTPKKGDLCIAKFSDGLWYRARVLKVNSVSSAVDFFYIDYGNIWTSKTSTDSAEIPAAFKNQTSFAKEYLLAHVALPKDDDYRDMSLKALQHELMDRHVKLNVERKGSSSQASASSSVPLVTVYSSKNVDVDIVLGLISDGLLLVDLPMSRNRNNRNKLTGTLSKYAESQEKAKADHINIWQFGDITEDDAREFGMSSK